MGASNPYQHCCSEKSCLEWQEETKDKFFGASRGIPAPQAPGALQSKHKHWMEWRLPATLSEMQIESQHLKACRVQAPELDKRVKRFLASEELVTEPGFTRNGVTELKKPASNWQGFVSWLHRRVRSVNELGGPRMSVVSWRTLKELGRMPRMPDDMEHILDAERLLEEYELIMDEYGKVDDRVICFSFFSHRWERPQGSDGGPHPDSTDHKKSVALAMFGEFGSCPIFMPHHEFDYYFWIDFSGVMQEDGPEKELGVCMLPAYVAACIQIIMYNSSTAAYEPRAWTRLERLLGYTYCGCPLFKYLDDSYPHKDLDIKDIVKANPNAFSLDELGGLFLKIRDPSGPDVGVTNHSDMKHVKSLSKTVTEANPINPARTWNNVNELVFDRDQIPLDIVHYGLDVEKQKGKLKSVS